MRFLRTLIRQLVVPNNVGPGFNRIEFGGTAPASLVTFYAGFGLTLVGGSYYYLANGRYTYQALLSDGSMVFGAFDGTTVFEAYEILLPSGAPPTGVTVFGKRSLSNLYVGSTTIVTAAAKYFNTMAATPGTTVSAVYVDMPGSPAVTITKAYDSGATYLEVHIYGTFFVAAGAAAGLAVGVAAGVTGDVSVTGLRSANSATNSHTPFGGVVAITGLAAGNHTITARWRKDGGAGTLVVDASDVFSMSVREVSAT